MDRRRRSYRTATPRTASTHRRGHTLGIRSPSHPLTESQPQACTPHAARPTAPRAHTPRRAAAVHIPRAMARPSPDTRAPPRAFCPNRRSGCVRSYVPVAGEGAAARPSRRLGAGSAPCAAGGRVGCSGSRAGHCAAPVCAPGWVGADEVWVCGRCMCAVSGRCVCCRFEFGCRAEDCTTSCGYAQNGRAGFCQRCMSAFDRTAGILAASSDEATLQGSCTYAALARLATNTAFAATVSGRTRRSSRRSIAFTKYLGLDNLCPGCRRTVTSATRGKHSTLLLDVSC